VPVLDHVVVAERGWSSLSELGALPRRDTPDSPSVSPKAPPGYGR
jgi:hypothetical protein